MQSNEQKPVEIAVGDFFCYTKSVKGGAIILSFIVTEVREKAIKADISIEPITLSGGQFTTIYDRTGFVPRSVIERDEKKMLNVKQWFQNRGELKTFPIKKYYFDNDKKVFC